MTQRDEIAEAIAQFTAFDNDEHYVPLEGLPALLEAGRLLARQVAARTEEGERDYRPDCSCSHCRPNTLERARMIVCSLCGNKRCPHAEWHGYVCTRSNLTDQIPRAQPTPPTPAASDYQSPPLKIVGHLKVGEFVPVGEVAANERAEELQSKLDSAHDPKSVGNIAWLAEQYKLRAEAAERERGDAIERMMEESVEHVRELSTYRERLTESQSQLAVVTAERDKWDQQLNECCIALEQWPLASGCNGHLCVAGHIENILKSLDDRESQLTTLRTALEKMRPNIDAAIQESKQAESNDERGRYALPAAMNVVNAVYQILPDHPSAPGA